MKQRRTKVCDERICVRLPNALIAHIAKECAKDGTKLSAFVRESLVEHLSPQEQTR